MQEGWRGGRREGTPCGGGSLSENTMNIRSWIPDILGRYNIRTVCDAGAGDLCWSRQAFAGVDYKAFDLVPRTPEVQQLDITKDALPQCDLIVCRAVLIHLDPKRVLRTLELFRESGKYLLATTEPSDNTFDPGNQCNPIDLTKAPFDLGEPLESVADLEGPDSQLALWKMR